MAELKKCPFCGGEAEVVKVHSGVAMFPYTVVCKSDECSASVGVFKETREEAIESWNNRATESEIRAKAIDEFKELAFTMFTDFDMAHGYPTLGDVETILYDVAEQLKGE